MRIHFHGCTEHAFIFSRSDTAYTPAAVAPIAKAYRRTVAIKA
jgi:hypothetical protein